MMRYQSRLLEDESFGFSVSAGHDDLTTEEKNLRQNQSFALLECNQKEWLLKFEKKGVLSLSELHD